MKRVQYDTFFPFYIPRLKKQITVITFHHAFFT